jgi:hypothetical protein
MSARNPELFASHDVFDVKYDNQDSPKANKIDVSNSKRVLDRVSSKSSLAMPNESQSAYNTILRQYRRKYGFVFSNL